MSTYAEQISAFTADRAVKTDRQKAIMDVSAEKGETLDAEQQDEFDTLQTEVEAIDKHLKRLQLVADADAKTAKPADGTTAANGSDSRGGLITVKTQPKLEPGIEFSRLFKSVGAAKGDMGLALRMATNRYGEDSNAAGTLKRLYESGSQRLEWSGMVEKAPVVAGSTVSGTWAADLVLDEGGAFADFAEFLRPATIVGKFGQGNIPSLRRVPFRTALGISTTGGAGYWVGEGAGKGLTAFNFDKTFLEPLKCANIVVLTQELLMSTSANAETMVRDEMRNALVELIDVAFIDPSNSGSSNVKPASITNGADSIAASAGGDADDIRLDLRSLIQKFINANNRGAGVVLVMRDGDALAASMLTNALGQPEFSDIGVDGGTIAKLPVITSQSVTSGDIVAVAPSEIYLADEGGFTVDVSREASVVMDSAPSLSSVTPTAAQMVSLWQTNSVGFLCERIINWSRRRSTAVAYITGAAWGGAVNT